MTQTTRPFKELADAMSSESRARAEAKAAAMQAQPALRFGSIGAYLLRYARAHYVTERLMAIAPLGGTLRAADQHGLGKLVQEVNALQGRVGALRDRVIGVDAVGPDGYSLSVSPMWDMTEAELRAHRSFTTKWSEEDGAFVGLCDQFPSLSCLDANEGKALAGIMGLVARMESENE